MAQFNWYALLMALFFGGVAIAVAAGVVNACWSVPGYGLTDGIAHGAWNLTVSTTSVVRNYGDSLVFFFLIIIIVGAMIAAGVAANR